MRSIKSHESFLMKEITCPYLHLKRMLLAATVSHILKVNKTRGSNISKALTIRK